MESISETIKDICRRTKEIKEQAFLQAATTIHSEEVYSKEEKEKILQLARMLDEGSSSRY